MFGRGKLAKDGVEAQGVVTESGADMSFAYGDQGYHVKVRVDFEDGQSTEFSGKIHKGLGKFGVGDVVPVRYDANDRSKLAIDEPALESIADDTRARVKEIKQEKADRKIAPGTESGVGIGAATGSAIERKLELDKLHESGAITNDAYEAELASIRADLKKY